MYSVFDGVIRISGFNSGGYGYYVVVRHYNGLETLYGHMSALKVESGQKIKA
ncbi:MAG TPA: peptidase M23, partial [Microscillaceae bacterium]|nr:peptidase M23 [Microscillaceae bacterium]